jgi:penicillin-binding protein 2
VDDPKIAIAVFVEYAGAGGSAAAPIANLVIEKYLTRKITNKALEERMLKADFMSKVILPGQKKPVPVDTTKKKPVTPVKPTAANKPVAINR